MRHGWKRNENVSVERKRRNPPGARAWWRSDPSPQRPGMEGRSSPPLSGPLTVVFWRPGALRGLLRGSQDWDHKRNARGGFLRAFQRHNVNVSHAMPKPTVTAPGHPRQERSSLHVHNPGRRNCDARCMGSGGHLRRPKRSRDARRFREGRSDVGLWGIRKDIAHGAGSRTRLANGIAPVDGGSGAERLQDPGRTRIVTDSFRYGRVGGPRTAQRAVPAVTSVCEGNGLDGGRHRTGALGSRTPEQSGTNTAGRGTTGVESPVVLRPARYSPGRRPTVPRSFQYRCFGASPRHRNSERIRGAVGSSEGSAGDVGARAR